MGRLALPPRARHTFVRHRAQALLDAGAAGLLANAPAMAVKTMGSPPWQLALHLSISSLGMFLSLYLGGRMARARKMPFVVVPGLGYAAAALLMAAVDDVLPFLVLLGLGALFEVVTRPGVAAVIRLNYPASQRGAVTGEIRRWWALVFLGANLGAAWLLDLAGPRPTGMIRAQMVAAGLLALGGYLVFRTIRVAGEADGAPDDGAPVGGASDPDAAPPAGVAVARSVTAAVRSVRGDARFLRYLAIGTLYAFGGLLYTSYVPAFLARDLRHDYVGVAVLTDVVPALLTFLLTGIIGRRVDRTNPWRAWAAIRLGWGLDPLLLAAAPAAAAVAPAAGFALPFLGRVSRGAVAGGSWILWWQVSVTHFAPPGADTTRYMGVIVFLNGLCRLLAPLTGAALLVRTSLPALFAVGGALVLLSAALSLCEARRERGDRRLATIAAFEAAAREDDP